MGYPIAMTMLERRERAYKDLMRLRAALAPLLAQPASFLSNKQRRALRIGLNMMRQLKREAGI